MRVKLKDLDDTFTYISDGTWFVKGSECKLIANCDGMGALLKGDRSPEEEYEFKLGRKKGNVYIDTEVCSWDEFRIYKNEEEVEIIWPKGTKMLTEDGLKEIGEY